MTPSELQPVGDTRKFRGVTAEGTDRIALPGGRAFTMVIAGAGVVGFTGDVPVP